MAVAIAASEVITAAGDGQATFAAMLEARSCATPLRRAVPERVHVAAGYQISGPGDVDAWLQGCLRHESVQAALHSRRRVVALVGTGLGKLHAIETVPAVDPGSLDFARVVRAALPGVDEVVTITNVCSSGGYVLALAQDLIEAGDADAVVACAVDGMTTSMLAMIGRVSEVPTDAVRPFDVDRNGVLLGEGAAVFVVVPDGTARAPLAPCSRRVCRATPHTKRRRTRMESCARCAMRWRGPAAGAATSTSSSPTARAPR